MLTAQSRRSGPAPSRSTAVVLVALVSALVTGCGGEPKGDGVEPQSTTSQASPPSELIDVGGRSLYLTCEGAGGPVVILEAGLTGDHLTWEKVMPEVRGSTRVCAYDRANISPSDTAPVPRTAEQMVEDLRALLSAAGEDPPYVMVGFSFGGLVSQLYARSHPDEVAGMVLVDANHPEEVDRFEAELTPRQIREDRKIVSSNDEGVDVFTSFTQVQQADALPDVPLVVVTSGISEGWPPGWDPKLFDRLRAEQQADLVQMVPDGTQLIARRSGHDVPRQQPGIVVEAVEIVLEKVAGR